ncbi:hypothetical protein [Streptomyces melanogenes]|uniref:hypothetical protein n=1 Tax=Streptomyces melanogenes TaxID=67326 RepID=UPI00379406F7
MAEDELITQLGLLLTQTRYARRALEDIERATATYATFTFTSVVAAGPRFGEPPLLNGALKVHVVNLADLTPGQGLGGLLEGLLGGVGRFLGNLPGGLVGATISTPALIAAMPTIDSLAGRIERILKLLGIGAAAPPTAASSAGASSPADSGTPLIVTLSAIKSAVDGLTGLFLAAGGQPASAARTSDLMRTPESDRWLRLADTSVVVLSATARLVDGLTLALPVVIGSISWLITRLGDIRQALAETIRFALRNALVLRGGLGVIAFDTLALLARMAATVVGVLAATLDGMLAPLFGAVREALKASFELSDILGQALKSTVDKLLNWLVPTVDTVLRNLGDLRVFRVLTHLVRVLPAIIPPIYELATDHRLGDTDAAALRQAADWKFLDALTPGTGTGATTPARPLPVPDLRIDKALVDRAIGAIDAMENSSSTGVRQARAFAQGELRGLDDGLMQASKAEMQRSGTLLGGRLDEVRKQADELAARVVVGDRVRPATGLEAIATAYESWLTGGGLTTLLGKITEHFTSPEGRAGVPQRAAEAALDPPRATVQIDEVLIDLGERERPVPHGSLPSHPWEFPEPPDRDYLEHHSRMRFDHDLRGGGGRLPLPH